MGAQCDYPTTICWSSHNNCVNSSSLVSGSPSSETSWNTTTYTWKCNRGDYTEKCTQTETTPVTPGESCPNWYWELWTSDSIEEIIGHECGQSGTDWWELQYNGTANGNSCVKCKAKSCPTWSSTTCNWSRVGFAGDDICYKCEEVKNYSIVNWTSKDWDLCVGSQRYMDAREYADIYNYPLSEQEACAWYDPNSHEDCYHDYVTNYDPNERVFVCSVTDIDKCSTSDYTTYCTNNPWWQCYISNSNDSCSSITFVWDVSMCGGNCGAAPYGAWSTQEISTCKWSMQYVQCK